VKATQPGYAAYVVEPELGGLAWIDGKVPTPHGDIAVHADATTIRVTGVAGQGVPLERGKTVTVSGAE